MPEQQGHQVHVAEVDFHRGMRSFMREIRERQHERKMQALQAQQQLEAGLARLREEDRLRRERFADEEATRLETARTLATESEAAARTRRGEIRGEELAAEREQTAAERDVLQQALKATGLSGVDVTDPTRGPEDLSKVTAWLQRKDVDPVAAQGAIEGLTERRKGRALVFQRTKEPAPRRLTAAERRARITEEMSELSREVSRQMGFDPDTGTKLDLTDPSVSDSVLDRWLQRVDAAPGFTPGAKAELRKQVLAERESRRKAREAAQTEGPRRRKMEAEARLAELRLEEEPTRSRIGTLRGSADSELDEGSKARIDSEGEDYLKNKKKVWLHAQDVVHGLYDLGKRGGEDWAARLITYKQGRQAPLIGEIPGTAKRIDPKDMEAFFTGKEDKERGRGDAKRFMDLVSIVQLSYALGAPGRTPSQREQDVEMLRILIGSYHEEEGPYRRDPELIFDDLQVMVKKHPEIWLPLRKIAYEGAYRPVDRLIRLYREAGTKEEARVFGNVRGMIANARGRAILESQQGAADVPRGTPVGGLSPEEIAASILRRRGLTSR